MRRDRAVRRRRRSSGSGRSSPTPAYVARWFVQTARIAFAGAPTQSQALRPFRVSVSSRRSDIADRLGSTPACRSATSRGRDEALSVPVDAAGPSWRVRLAGAAPGPAEADRRPGRAGRRRSSLCCPQGTARCSARWPPPRRALFESLVHGGDDTATGRPRDPGDLERGRSSRLSGPGWCAPRIGRESPVRPRIAGPGGRGGADRASAAERGLAAGPDQGAAPTTRDGLRPCLPRLAGGARSDAACDGPRRPGRVGRAQAS